jgi:hypothetical protein
MSVYFICRVPSYGIVNFEIYGVQNTQSMN